MIAFLKSLFRREPKATWGDVLRIHAEFDRKNALEDALFNEWYAERSHKFLETRMMRMTEVSPLEPMQMITQEGFRDFSQFCRERGLV